MKQISQFELLSEGFWDTFKTNPLKSAVRGAMGLAGGAVKGIAKTLDYIAPEITQPLHNLERGGRDITQEVQKGWSKGFGGKEAEAEEVLIDIGYKYVPGSLTKTGRNLVAQAKEIIGHDQNGKEQLGKVHRVLFDQNMDILDIGGKGRRGYMTNPYAIKMSQINRKSKRS